MDHCFPAPAKINLYLRVNGIRPDGMHKLDTAFAYINLCDQLKVSLSEDIVVDCSKQHLAGENNLVHKILSSFKASHGINRGLSIYIEKHIPVQAGLGGGSSDAATALMVANRLWNIQADTNELINFATPFGADIPCFLYGQASLAQGIGEKLVDYPRSLPAGFLLLARPATGLSTREVFHHFDHALRADNALTAPKGLDTIRRDLPMLAENDLETSACNLNPDVASLLACMRQYSDRAWMSGSGSACVALFDHDASAKKVATLLKQQRLADWTHTGCIKSVHPMQQIGT
ncbi:MAG: 4-(cytidine 5'-diphospho)-2-C-methyl-D-erythritol kinase [Mariprofundus sp.]|nr:4-(cytidine 5'-diphospho)-2-C-methyl-D-erythritol kinase [Mariprofundus sp.]